MNLFERIEELETSVLNLSEQRARLLARHEELRETAELYGWVEKPGGIDAEAFVDWQLQQFRQMKKAHTQVCAERDQLVSERTR